MECTSIFSPCRDSSGQLLSLHIKMASGRGEIPGNISLKYETNEKKIVFFPFILLFGGTGGGACNQKLRQKYSTDKVVFHPAAIESGASSGLFGALSCPIGMTRRNTSYDELMEAPMHSPPSDMSVNILWKDPVIPQHRFRNTAEVHSCSSAAQFATCI